MGIKFVPYLSIIAVTGSRDSVLDKEAYESISDIVGEKTVRKARNEFNSHYKNKIQNIASYTNRNEIGFGLSSIAEYTKDKDRVIKAAKIMSLDKIVDSVKNIVHPRSLVKIAEYTEDKDIVMESIKTIRRYDGDTAQRIASELSSIAEYTKDKDAVMEAIKTIRRYKGNAAKEIGFGLSSIAEYTKDKDRIIKAAKRMSLDEIVDSVKNNKIRYTNELLLIGAYTEDRDAVMESIEEVLIGADYNYFGFTGGNTILRAVESNNPLDYDNRVQIACVYLPQNYHNGIYNYCKDYYSEGDRKGFTLVRYNLGGKTLGSAICYMEKNNFLVDSIEGHRGFRKEQIFKAVYQDLLDRAREKDAKTVIFSENGLNETPRKFIEFLGSLGLKKGSVKMKLSTKGYLEAEKSAAKGYIVNFE